MCIRDRVSAGAAKVGSRWLESDAIETFTLDPSDVALNQIYSVVIRSLIHISAV